MPINSTWKPIHGLWVGILLGLIETMLLPINTPYTGLRFAITVGLLLYLALPLCLSFLFSRGSGLTQVGYQTGVFVGMGSAITAVLVTSLYGYLFLVSDPFANLALHKNRALSAGIVNATYFCMIAAYHLVAIMIALIGASIGSAKSGKASTDQGDAPH